MLIATEFGSKDLGFEAEVNMIPPLARLKCIVLGIENFEQMEAWHRRLPRHLWTVQFPTLTRAIERGRFELVWYIQGRYIEWLDSIEKPAQFQIITVRSASFTDGGGELRIIKCKGGNLYMRLLSASASMRVSKYETKLIATGELVSTALWESHGEGLSSAYSLCSAMWNAL